MPAPTPLQDRMLAAAASYSALNTLLGNAPFRWYFDTLQQGSAYPAVVVTQVSGNKTYSVSGRLATGFSRFQFTVWGGQYAAGSTARDAVAAALVGFMDQWNGGSGIAGLSQYSNLNVLDREMLYTQKDSPVYLRILDFQIFTNDTL